MPKNVAESIEYNSKNVIIYMKNIAKNVGMRHNAKA